MNKIIERTHLAIIREVHRRGTLTEAAAELCLTQSALSHAIIKLEQQIGTRVWTKEGRLLRFTQAGKYLLSLANRLLPQFSHAEQVIQQYAHGQRGSIRIGIECHPCYRWLLRAVSPFLQQWPDVDVDVRQEFQFGGIGALVGHEIDLLITPDPLQSKGLEFTKLFDYELVLVVSKNHSLASALYVRPIQLTHEVLITYPVETERLDIFTHFLVPANCRPAKHKTIENTDMLLQMVAATRGVTALPSWLVDEYTSHLPIKTLHLGKKRIKKHLVIGKRSTDTNVDYINGFIHLAKECRL
jgi:LysR family transcriptional regulator for metE and metH